MARLIMVVKRVTIVMTYTLKNYNWQEKVFYSFFFLPFRMYSCTKFERWKTSVGLSFPVHTKKGGKERMEKNTGSLGKTIREPGL